MTEQTQRPEDDDADRTTAPTGGDITGQPPGPTVEPEADDPEREGEERFDAG